MNANGTGSEASSKRKPFFHWFFLLTGLAVYVAAQSTLVLVPLWTRDLPPEVDDSLAFLVRTQVMEECLFQDCPALEDLKAQLLEPTSDPRVTRQRALASFPFPFYHPLFSAVLLGLKHSGLGLITGYKVLWSAAPAAFGVAFAWLLTSLWGMLPAGAALLLLAFKVYPSTGLHYLTPSNFAMGIAVVMWARIIQRKGNAPWTLVGGSLFLLATHPIGAIYVLISFALALLVSARENRRRVWIAASSLVGAIALLTLLVSLMKHPSLVNVLDEMRRLPGAAGIIQDFTSNLAGALASIVNLKAGLFGPLSIFFPAVAVGVLMAKGQRRKMVLRFALLYSLVLFVALHHTHVISPDADLFFRLWIPLVAVLFGAVGNAVVFAFSAAMQSLKTWTANSGDNPLTGLEKLWAVILFAVLIGYGTDTVLSGAEILRATQEYMRDRQPVSFDRSQVESMLSRSLPGDRVLYTSTMCMAFYFIHGAMQRGAVYHHPAFSGDAQFESAWLRRPDLRFAVTYNPTVYHPSYATLDEKDRCISMPEFRYSPLGARRKEQPLGREGFIVASEFQWIQVDPGEGKPGNRLRLFVRNPGEASEIVMVPIDQAGTPLWTEQTKTFAAAQRTGWLPLEITQKARESAVTGFRLLFPNRDSRFFLGGIVFDDAPNYWPWAQKASLKFAPRGSETAEMEVRFDWEASLPFAGSKRAMEVLDDQGSSVLFHIND